MRSAAAGKGRGFGWGAVLASVKASGGRDLGWMCLITLFAFILWNDFAFILYLMFYGAHMPDPGQFALEVLTTQKGVAFILASNVVGAGLALFVFDHRGLGSAAARPRRGFRHGHAHFGDLAA